MSLGLISQPLPLFGNDLAIIIGLVYGWFPDMVLPCYAAIERLDFSLVEAAQDLYANEVRSFLRVIFPLTLPGVIAGSILVFIPSLGAYVTPDLLGGAKSVMIGNVIQSQFLTVRDFPFGSAFSFVLDGHDARGHADLLPRGRADDVREGTMSARTACRPATGAEPRRPPWQPPGPG